MNIIARPRWGGKTYEAVQWLKVDPHRVLLVVDEGERRRLIRQYRLNERQVLVAEGAEVRLTGRMGWLIGIDNIDLLGWRTVFSLGRFIHHVDLVTVTEP